MVGEIKLAGGYGCGTNGAEGTHWIFCDELCMSFWSGKCWDIIGLTVVVKLLLLSILELCVMSSEILEVEDAEDIMKFGLLVDNRTTEWLEIVDDINILLHTNACVIC